MSEIPNREWVRKAINTARDIAKRYKKSGWPASTLTSKQRGKVERAIVLLQASAPDHYPIWNDDRAVTLPVWHRGLIDTLGFVAVTFKRWIGHRIDDRPLSSPEDVLRTLNLAEEYYDLMPDVLDLKRSAGGGVVMVRADTASRQSGLSTDVIRKRAKREKWPTGKAGRMNTYPLDRLQARWPDRKFLPANPDNGGK